MSWCTKTNSPTTASPRSRRHYEGCGHIQPLAQRSHQRNSWFRIVATLNALTGQVTYRQRSKLDVGNLGLFYAELRAEYPKPNGSIRAG